MTGASIRFRLAVSYALILVAAFAAFGIAVRFAIERSIEQTVDRELYARLAAMREFLDREAKDPDAGTLVDELAEEDAITPAGALFRIADAGGRWIYRSHNTATWDPRPPSPARTESVATRNLNGQRVRILTAPVVPGVAEIGAPLDAFDAMLARLMWTLVLASPIAAALACLAGYWMSGRALRPVARIAETADAIQAEDLSRRLILRGTGDELDRLSSTLNAMFERLDAAFRRTRAFTADASHELRTPIAIIRTTAELARSKPRTREEYEASLAQIENAGMRASRVVEDLLTLARADAGVSAAAREPVDIAAVVREALEEAKPLAESAGLSLSAEFRDACPATGDPEALYRLFVTLLDNAVKYNERGGRIAVSVRRETNGAGPVAVAEVRDTGLGIPADDLPHVFERFYRAAKDRSRATGGAGLGLSIAQHIARQHGGEIEAESAAGQGSVFRVRLPLNGGLS